MDLRKRLQETLGDTYFIDRELGTPGMSRVFLAQEMALQRTVGEVYDDQILDKVFKEFCLGK